MLLQAVSDLALDPARCAIVRDKMSDIEAGCSSLALRLSDGAAVRLLSLG